MRNVKHRGSGDFKRVWKCPVCGEIVRTGGEVVNRLCRCQRDKPPNEQVWMKLIKNGAVPTTRHLV